MVRFVHTSDWQLGMTRRFLSAEAQSRFTDARIQAIRTIGEIARSGGAQFVVVAGDVFESNMVERQLVLRALEALREAAVPFYLLPGNHDPLAAGSVFTSAAFTANCPPNVVVLDGTPVQPAEGVTLLSSPWRSKKMTEDAIASACAAASEFEGLKIVVGHGQAEPFAPDLEKADIIRMGPATEALACGAVHYIALGDRHSRTSVGESGRMWYSGAPEPTDFDEEDPGLVLDVTLEADRILVEPLRTAAWKFLRTKAVIDSPSDVTRLRALLDGLPGKDRTVLKLAFEGTVSLALLAELDAAVDHFRPMFAAIERRERDSSELVVVPNDMDFSELALSGFAAEATKGLAALAGIAGEGGREGRDAIGLLYRLARGAA